MINSELKYAIIKLRKQGKTYSEIQKNLNVKIPKSTISNWCNNVKMPASYENRIKNINKKNLSKARILSIRSKKQEQSNRLNKILSANKHLARIKYDIDSAKALLAMLYLCEGTKSISNATITLGNSDPKIISLFLQLLRFCYRIDENKFRCTIQCRDDQNIKELEKFWSSITNIPKSNFYSARIDPRSIGKKSHKSDYKGVCRINYFSADIFWNLMKIGEIICSK